MFERYSEAARRTLFFARYEASVVGGRTIVPEHVLLGLAREAGDLVSRIFAAAEVDRADVRRELATAVKAEERFSTTVEVPFDAATKRVLQAAADEADRLLSTSINAEHLLLGILLHERSLAASALVGRGMSLESVREAIVQLRAAGAQHESRPQEFSVSVRPTRMEEPGVRSHGRPGSADFEGYTLRDLLARVHDVRESRIELPSSVDVTARYDVSAAWPPDQGEATEHDLIRFGLEHFFGVTIMWEAQRRDVYVLTAPEGTSATRSQQDVSGGGIGFASAEFRATTPIAEPPQLGSGIVISELSATNATMESFAYSIEDLVGRLVVDETNLQGRFDFTVRADAPTVDEFRELLRQQLKLELTPAQRQIWMLVVRET